MKAGSDLRERGAGPPAPKAARTGAESQQETAEGSPAQPASESWDKWQQVLGFVAEIAGRQFLMPAKTNPSALGPPLLGERAASENCLQSRQPRQQAPVCRVPTLGAGQARVPVLEMCRSRASLFGLHRNRALDVGITLEIIQMLKKKNARRVVYTKIPSIWWLGERIARAEL